MISKNQIKYVHQLELKKFRKQEGLYIAEGHKVVGDLLKAGFVPKHIFATKEWLSQNHFANTIEVSNEELTRLSLLQHPQQVLALFPIPKNTLSSRDLFQENQLSLFLDNIQDPGNLGTIIRIADWFGIDTIFCSEGTVDAWNPKVIQATMGSIARVNMIYTDSTEFFNSLPSDYPIYGTFLDGQNIYAQQLSQHGVIVMGNEGNGISDTVRAHVTHKLLIPDFHNGNTADSLNVAIATAITCSEFCRRRL
jgi:TrmH family RNA methyltransferase